MRSNDRIQLYHFERCPYCEKVRRVFRALNLNYESHLIEPDDRRKVEEVSGQENVPVIIDGETVVNESTDIAGYLDEYYSDGVRIIPESPEDRGLVYVLDRYADNVLSSVTYRALVNIDEDGEPLDTEGKEALQRGIDCEADYMNQMLTNRSFLVGVSLSLADISVSAFLSRLTDITDFTPDRSYAQLWKWYRRIEDQLNETS